MDVSTGKLVCRLKSETPPISGQLKLELLATIDYEINPEGGIAASCTIDTTEAYEALLKCQKERAHDITPYDREIVRYWIDMAKNDYLYFHGRILRTYRDLELINPMHTANSWNKEYERLSKLTPDEDTRTQISSKSVLPAPAALAIPNTTMMPTPNLAVNPGFQRLSSVRLIAAAERGPAVLPQRGRSETKSEYWYSREQLKEVLGLNGDFDLAHWLRQSWVLDCVHEYATHYLDKIRSLELERARVARINGEDTVHLHYYNRDNAGHTTAIHVIESAVEALRTPNSIYLTPIGLLDTEGWDDEQHKIRFITQLVQNGRQHNAWNKSINSTLLCTQGYRLSSWLLHANRLSVVISDGEERQSRERMGWLLLLRDAFFRRNCQLERDPALRSPVSNLSDPHHEPTNQANPASMAEISEPQFAEVVAAGPFERPETSSRSSSPSALAEVSNNERSSHVTGASRPHSPQG